MMRERSFSQPVRVVGLVVVCALTASSMVLAARAFRVEELDPRPAPPKVSIALDYWDRNCNTERPFHENVKLRAFRERLQMAVEMEMRESPPLFASGDPVSAYICIDVSGFVTDVRLVSGRGIQGRKAAIDRVLRSWRYSPGEPVCTFERLRVKDSR